MNASLLEHVGPNGCQDKPSHAKNGQVLTSTKRAIEVIVRKRKYTTAFSS